MLQQELKIMQQEVHRLKAMNEVRDFIYRWARWLNRVEYTKLPSDFAYLANNMMTNWGTFVMVFGNWGPSKKYIVEQYAKFCGNEKNGGTNLEWSYHIYQNDMVYLYDLDKPEDYEYVKEEMRTMDGDPSVKYLEYQLGRCTPPPNVYDVTPSDKHYRYIARFHAAEVMPLQWNEGPWLVLENDSWMLQEKETGSWRMFLYGLFEIRTMKPRTSASGFENWKPLIPTANTWMFQDQHMLNLEDLDRKSKAISSYRN